MAFETRVNLRRLLVDIRDAYSSPVEEVILTELIANALDSSATQIDLLADPERHTLRCTDNGKGMRRKDLKEYHDIAASTKTRGQGIGFAGIGAKLSLLVADEVVTETRGGYGACAATSWHLTSTNRAPWKFVPPSGYVSSPRGTAVHIALVSTHSRLCDPVFVREAVAKHFFPLLDDGMRSALLKFIYPRGVALAINGEPVQFEMPPSRTFFKVSLGGRARHPVGIGYLRPLTESEDPARVSGIAVSTYGKIIKHGWEWLGIFPRSRVMFTGCVEIPGLSEILTTNKSDFLNDAASLKKWYRFRKAVQDAVMRVLVESGESPLASAQPIAKELKAISRDIESALQPLSDDFPELVSLVGERRRRMTVSAALTDTPERQGREERMEGIKDAVPNPEESRKSKDRSVSPEEKTERLELSETPDGSLEKRVTRKAPGLKLLFEDFESGEGAQELGRFIDDTLRVNTAHPAWRKARDSGFEEYHTVMVAAWTLAQFLEQKHAPYEFISKFLASWSSGGQQRLL